MRHGPTQAFGVICSPSPSAYYDGKSAFVAGWEDILVWDVKKAELVSMWHSPSHTATITHISASPSYNQASTSAAQPRTFAVAYQDGSIKLWSYATPASSSTAYGADLAGRGADEIVTFNGHKKAVTCMTWSQDGTRLLSGGSEGEIISWDAVGEVGMYRLKGHRGPVTSLHLLPHPTLTSHPGFLVSTSKDTFLKLWDLQTQHCIQTLVVGRAEVLCSDILADAAESPQDEQAKGGYRIITGSGDGELRTFRLERQALQTGVQEDQNGNLLPLVTSLGPLPLPSGVNSLTNPIQMLQFHPCATLHQHMIYIQTSDKAVTVLRIRTVEEMAAKQARRKKREREKAKAKAAEGGADDTANLDEDEETENGNEWLARITGWCAVRSTGKIRSFSLVENEDAAGAKGIQILLALSNNSLETHMVPTPPLPGLNSSKSKLKGASGQIEPSRVHVLDMHGHRTDVRCLSVSGDDQVLASASNGSLKIWNLRTTACIRTMECGYALSCTFMPGDRHVLIGTKAGELELFDIAASSMIFSIKAHDGPVWSIDLRADGGGVVSGSADKDVKFWDITMKDVEGPGSKIVTRLGEERIIKTKQMTLVHVKTLKMTDDVLAVKYSPNGKLLAVSLLDSTVKVFFQDTLKFFLSLYGHKLPVLAMDISSDSKLIVTCSADKNVKIWGLDFGDCHKSIFAHEESIMQVAFEKNSHYFWTVSKDRLLKYWDGDKFEAIQQLEGHHGEVWALAVSQQGDFVVTGSHDKSIRVWEKTEEPLFLEEERERELEQMYETGVADSLNRKDRPVGAAADGSEVGDVGDEVEDVQKATSETLMAGERIMDAIELADADRQLTQDYEESKAKATGEMKDALLPPQRSALIVASGNPTPDRYVLGVIEKVPTANMEDALLVLPFKQVISLLEYLDIWAKTDANITLTSRILFFLLKTHHHQIVSNLVMRTTLVSLREHIRDSLQRQKQTLGYNMAALKFIRRQYEADRTAGLMESEGMDEEKVRERIAEGQKKRKRISVKA